MSAFSLCLVLGQRCLATYEHHQFHCRGPVLQSAAVVACLLAFCAPSSWQCGSAQHCAVGDGMGAMCAYVMAAVESALYMCTILREVGCSRATSGLCGCAAHNVELAGVFHVPNSRQVLPATRHSCWFDSSGFLLV